MDKEGVMFCVLHHPTDAEIKGQERTRADLENKEKKEHI
jgi:3-keto-L-gulonate-6-phosphate decarboxylase